MPTYDYQCAKCGHKFELFQSIKADPIKKCPACGKNQAKRLIGTGAGLIFKGSGFYITDYRSEAYKTAAKDESGGGRRCKVDRREKPPAAGGDAKAGAKNEAAPKTDAAPKAARQSGRGQAGCGDQDAEEEVERIPCDARSAGSPLMRRPPAAEAAGKSPFPFCSERCRLIDLGRWLTDKYQIPASPDENGAAAPKRTTSMTESTRPPGTDLATIFLNAAHVLTFVANAWN